MNAVTRYTNEQTGESAYVTAIERLHDSPVPQERQPYHVIIRPALCVATPWN